VGERDQIDKEVNEPMVLDTNEQERGGQDSSKLGTTLTKKIQIF